MILQNLLGWFTLLVIILGTILISKKYPNTKNFLFIALFLRSIFVILDQYFISLPDSTGDAYVFEQKAFLYSKEYGFNIIRNILPIDSFFISKFISIFYSIFERSPMLAKMLSVGFGTGSVLLIYNLSLIIWGRDVAIKAGWVAALFPSFILYSSLILREVYVIFFLTYALIGCVNFISKANLISLTKAIFGFLVASLFHGPIIIGLFFFLIYIFLKIIKQNNFFLYFKKKNAYLIFLLPILLLPTITYFLGYYSIPKIGNFKNFSNIEVAGTIETKNFEEKIIFVINKASLSSNNNPVGAKYPSWTIPNNFKEIIFLAPVRMLYFLYSPFPWDIKRIKHIIGLFDAFFYIFLTYCAFRNRRNLFNNPKTFFLILIFFSYILIYSFGVGNFGTGIRHRLKFIGILIAIAGPKIPRFKLF